MKGLVQSFITIDKYKPKIGDEEDTVVVTFTVTYEKPALDLVDFIQSGHVDHLDVEASVSPEPNGKFKVFVEFQREPGMFEKVNGLLTDINQIVSKDLQWEYVAFKNGDVKKPFNRENFEEDIIDNKVKYRMMYLT